MRLKFPVIHSCALALVFVSADFSYAQRHHHGSHGGVTVIPVSPLLWGGGFYHPYYPGFGLWYGYPLFGFPPGVYPQDHAVTVRLQVSPVKHRCSSTATPPVSSTTTTVSFSACGSFPVRMKS